jgi:hypothetical protein
MYGKIKRNLKNETRKETQDVGYPSDGMRITERKLTINAKIRVECVAGGTIGNQNGSDAIMKELGVYSVSSKLQDYRNHWLGQLDRIVVSRTQKKEFKYTARGRRNYIEAASRWMDK